LIPTPGRTFCLAQGLWVARFAFASKLYALAFNTHNYVSQEIHVVLFFHCRSFIVIQQSIRLSFIFLIRLYFFEPPLIIYIQIISNKVIMIAFVCISCLVRQFT